MGIRNLWHVDVVAKLRTFNVYRFKNNLQSAATKFITPHTKNEYTSTIKSLSLTHPHSNTHPKPCYNSWFGGVAYYEGGAAVAS